MNLEKVKEFFKKRKILIAAFLFVVTIAVVIIMLTRSAVPYYGEIIYSPKVDSKLDYNDGHILAVSAIELDRALKEDETIEYQVDVIINNSIKKRYTAHASAYDFDKEQTIKMGVVIDMLKEDLEKVSAVDLHFDVIERKNVEQEKYQHKNQHQYTYELKSQKHRFKVELSDSYKRNGGIALFRYSNNEREMKYLSYIADEDFLGVVEDEDLNNKDESSLEGIDIYQVVKAFEE